jgi:hypothetical protein
MPDPLESPEVERLADDLLIGAEAIRPYIRAKNVDQVYYFARTGHWPIGRLGKMLVASKRQLDRHARKITSGS